MLPFIDSFTIMSKNRLIFIFLMLALGASPVSASIVEFKGKITLLSGGGMPATAILRCPGDESYTGVSNIDKDGGFSFKVDVKKVALYNLRLLRLDYDVMLSAAEPLTTLNLSLDGDQIKDINVEHSRENDAYKAFKPITNLYDAKLISHFRFCEKEDSCEKELHNLLSEYAHELSIIQENFKGTYTADVLCKMKMPTLAKSSKGTLAEFRRGYFDNVNFSDSSLFATPTYKDMLALFIDYYIEPSLSKEEAFLKYFTDKIKPNQLVLHKSAYHLFDELFRAQKEKMLVMFIKWYNTGDNKAAINNPVMDAKLKTLTLVMPGQTYIDVPGADTNGAKRSLKDVVEKSKCTLLLFWSSECSHCRDEMPFIKEYYEKYHAKGFDVFAISIENDPAKWKAFIRDKELPWTNVIGDRSVNPNPAMQYVSTSTPTLVLIDSKGIILHRFIDKSKLEKRIIEGLK